MLPAIKTTAHRRIDAIRDLGLLTMTGSHALLSCQLDHAKGFLGRRGDHLRQALAEPSGQSEHWTAALFSLLHEAAESTRECIRLSAAAQAHTMRLLERQTAVYHAVLGEAQEIVVAALANNGVADQAGETATAPARRTTRTRSAAQPAAAEA